MDVVGVQRIRWILSCLQAGTNDRTKALTMLFSAVLIFKHLEGGAHMQT